MKIEEIWSYAIGFLTCLQSKMPHSCEDWTDLFALLVISTTFFCVSLPRAVSFYKEKKGKNSE